MHPRNGSPRNDRHRGEEVGVGADEATAENDAGGAATPYRVIALLALLAAGTSLILSLLFFGERGNFLVAVLSLLLAFLFGMANLLVRRELVAVWKGLSKRATAASISGLVSLSLVIATVIFLAARVPQIGVTIADIRIEGKGELTESTPATIVFQGPTPSRETLRLKLRLVDYIGSGDCTTSATLTLEPFLTETQAPLVSVPEPATETREGEAVEIPLGGSVPDLRIKVMLNSNVGCKVGLQVSEAVFYG